MNCSNAQLREIYSETLQSALLGAIAAIRIDDQNAQEGRGSWPSHLSDLIETDR